MSSTESKLGNSSEISGFSDNKARETQEFSAEEAGQIQSELDDQNQTENKEKKALIIHEAVFQPKLERQTGKVMGYESSAPDRKRLEIEMGEGAFIPVPGVEYSVKVTKDTNPEDPTKGKYYGKIVDAIDLSKMPNLEEDVNHAGLLSREQAGLSREISGHKKNASERLKASDPNYVPLVENFEQSLEEMHQGLQTKQNELLGPDGSPQRALLELRGVNLITAMREHVRLEQEYEDAHNKETELLTRMAEQKELGMSVKGLRQILTTVRVSLAENASQQAELVESSPEAHYGIHLSELKNYKKDLQVGRLVETPYVKHNAETVATQLKLGNPVFIYGHLGSGKTELAMHVARNFILNDRADLQQKADEDFEKWLENNPDTSASQQVQKKNEFISQHKSAVVISGSKYTSLAEFYGHQSLAISEVDPQEYKKFQLEVETEYDNWVAKNKKDLESLKSEIEREGEKNRAHDRIFQTNLTKFESGTVSKFNLGPVYRAMEEGRPLIIDEVNAIPHATLIDLNHVLTRKVGEPFLIQEENRTITIKEGFGVIMTGNLNQGQQKYVDREELDPAFLSRLFKLEQDYLPQSKDGAVEEAHLGDNELYRVVLARMMDRRGNIEAPAGSLEKLWRLCKATRFIQDCFSGKIEALVNNKGGLSSFPYQLRESVLSMRAVDSILSNWINSDFDKELDYYIWESFIKQATDPADRAFLFQTFKDNAFFTSNGWDIEDNDIDFKNIRNFNINAPENPDAEIVMSGPRKVIDIVYGPAPERKEWPAYYQEVDGAEVAKQIEEMKSQVDDELKDLRNDPNIPEALRGLF